MVFFSTAENFLFILHKVVDTHKIYDNMKLKLDIEGMKL